MEPLPTTSEDALIDLLLLAEEWQEERRTFTARDLCPDRPELWPALEQGLRDLTRLSREMHVAEASSADGHAPPKVTRAARGPFPAIKGYELLEEVGHGGMGVVYRARQVGLNRTVAIKTFAGAFKPGSRQRFGAEAETVARLHHPNIVQIHDVGEADGTPYFCMEWVSGGDLAQSMTGRPQAPRAAAELIATLAQAIHTAHAQGIIHRDLKPANILLTTNGELKISDFGLAKRLEEELALTRSQVIGTPSYMAPEQVRPGSANIGAEADVYALGVILYELLTGRVPHAGENSVETVIQVLEREPVPPSQLVPKLPRDVETICLKCLAKKPSHRYASAELLAADLRRWLNHEPVLARPVGPVERLTRWCQRRPAIAALLAAVIVAVVVGLTATTWQWRKAVAATGVSATAQHKAEAERVKAEAERNKALQLATDLRVQRDVARWQTYRSTISAAATALRFQQITTARKLLLEAPAQFRGWEWEYLNAQLDRADAVLEGHRLQVHCVELSPDDTLIVSGSEDRTARVWDARTGKTLHVLDGHGSAVHKAVFNSTGELIATRGVGNFVRVWDARSGELKSSLRVGEQDVMFMAFTPDGRALVCGSREGTVHIFPELSQDRAIQVRIDQTFLHPLALSPDGGRVVASAGDKRLVVIDTATGRVIDTWPGDTGVVTVGAFSPDGQRFASSDNSTDYSLRIRDAKTGRTLAAKPGHTLRINSIAFSRDGSRIVTASMDQTARLWDAKTGDAITELRGHTGFIVGASFSRDGSRILSCSDDSTARIWSATGERAGKQLAVLRGHVAGVWDARFSGDGSRVITASNDSTLRVWDVALAESDGVLVAHTARVSDVVFTPDGRQIISVSGDGTVRVWDAMRERRVEYVKCENAMLSAVALGPGGKSLLVVPHLAPVLFRFDFPFTDKPPTPLRLEGQRHVGGLVAIHPRRPLVAIVAAKSDDLAHIVLLDLETGRQLAVLGTEPPAGPYSVAFSPDGAHLLAGWGPGTCRIWSLEPFEKLQSSVRVVQAHEGVVYDVSFNRNGSMFATAGADMHVRLWDTKTLEPRGDLVHGSPITCVRFHRDGTRLAAGCADGSIRLWDLATKEEVADLRGHTGAVHAMEFSPDGSMLASAGDLTVRIWSAVPRRSQTSIRAGATRPAIDGTIH